MKATDAVQVNEQASMQTMKSRSRVSKTTNISGQNEPSKTHGGRAGILWRRRGRRKVRSWIQQQFGGVSANELTGSDDMIINTSSRPTRKAKCKSLFTHMQNRSKTITFTTVLHSNHNLYPASRLQNRIIVTVRFQTEQRKLPVNLKSRRNLRNRISPKKQTKMQKSRSTTSRQR